MGESPVVVLLVSEGSFEERLEVVDGKRALFAAAEGDDQETVALERSSMAPWIATLLRDEFAASTGRAALALPPDPVAELRERVRDALELFAVQFHPEKSQKVGFALLKRFVHV